MDQPVEVRGSKNICSLMDVKDWRTARDRLRELGVKVLYPNGRPVVNVAEVNSASKKWFGKKKK